MIAVVVALISAAGVVAAAWVSGGRHVKEIKRQLTPATGRTLAAEIGELRGEVAAVAVALGRHESDELRHRGHLRRFPK